MQISNEQRNYRETVFDNPLSEMPITSMRRNVFIVAPLIGGYERFRQIVLTETLIATDTSIAVDAFLNS